LFFNISIEGKCHTSKGRQLWRSFRKKKIFLEESVLKEELGRICTIERKEDKAERGAAQARHGD
jgi:hypothetical protein